MNSNYTQYPTKYPDLFSNIPYDTAPNAYASNYYTPQDYQRHQTQAYATLYPSLNDLRPQPPSLTTKVVKLIENTASRALSLAIGVSKVGIGAISLTTAIIVAGVTAFSWQLSLGAIVAAPPIGIILALGTAGLFYTELKMISFSLYWFASSAQNFKNAFSR